MGVGTDCGMRLITVCDNCTTADDAFHRCRAYEDSCVHDGINCPDYVKTCCCDICFPDWQDDLKYEKENSNVKGGKQ